uniref:Uncharacterized protein n=2 Tax=Setaria italica TaxID=4555 RepID=K3YYW0_SETIT
NTWELENTVRQKLLVPEQLPSSYDTAWVAMVHAKGAPQAPRFPLFVEWILQNQHNDGSWGLGHLDPCSLGKDAISSTLSCILALKTWNIGDEHIRKGLCFIEKNSSYIMDEKCSAPLGFNIIFPGMIRLGIDLGLEFPLKQSDVDGIFRLREIELRQSMALGRKAYMAYIAEGLADVQDWDGVLTYQSKNGSLFNSPSATAALAIHGHNANALKYLEFLVNKLGSSAPTIYPSNVHSQLCMIDVLQNMGISYYFAYEKNNILDMTYRSWLQYDEEIIMDMETCAMAFRLLRMHGYDISSDAMSHFADESRFQESLHGHINDTKTLLKLYKASQVCIYEDECNLQNIGSWSGKLLHEQLSSNRLSIPIMRHEVEGALKFPFHLATVGPLEHKRNIEHFNTKGIRMQKSAFLACQAAEDILALATQKFHISQSLYKKELGCIERWAKEAGLNRFKFTRAVSLDLPIFMASTIFPPELYHASIAWIQNSILTTIVDDFFDGGGSTEELENLVTLIEKWDAHAGIGFCSEDVEIMFYAIYNTNNQIGAKAAEVQNRRVIGHIAKVWVNAVRANMTEAEWTRKRYVPTMQEYMPVAEVTMVLGPIVSPSLYLVGPELSEDIVRGSEYKDLLRHASICCRLLNDIQTYDKEKSQGIINSVLLQVLGHGASSSEAAKREILGLVADSRRELLRLVLSKEATIPRSCRDIFWNTYKLGHLFYSQGDGFSMSQELAVAVNAVVHEPLQVTPPSRLKRG